ncbi:MAG: UDP-N-acetylmuramoyl-L-alanine--D-glutamate ligase [Bifidobacteriaceae bacterium]|nr:UDP-N-acetylmuramoyl-L-alanine--D-glutamate ligase [Bifidobacteriaceae bacterium]
MIFEDRRVGIAGLGVSGRAAAAALEPLGADLCLIDDVADGARRPDQVELETLDLLVVSPGWAPSSPLLRAAREAGLPIWSEVELAWQLRANPAAPWLAVTGTNGKTTAVSMLAAMLKAGGATARAAGNVGDPLVTAVLAEDVEVFAVELSSFQLHHTHSMRALASVVLNVAPDHLDWHGSRKAYAADKARVWHGVQDALVYNADDLGAARLAKAAKAADAARPARPVSFTLRAPRLGQLGVVDGLLVDRAFSERRYRHAEALASFDDLNHLAGPDGRVAPHLAANALAASALALAYGTPPDAIGGALSGFHLGAHRLAKVGAAGGVRFVDDSKATNAHAAAAALASFPAGSVVWIAGGLAKGATFETLVTDRADRLKGAVLIGLDHAALATALAGRAPQVPVVEVEPGPEVMDRAVKAAVGLADAGDSVLLAPAGASMDQFESYADRGRQFADAVARLGGANVA